MKEGTFNAVCQKAVFWTSDKGAEMVDISGTINDGSNEAFTASICLVQKDGTVSQKTVDLFRSAFDWRGDFNAMDVAGKAVEIVTGWETFTKEDGTEKQTLRVKYLNAIGGSRKMADGNQLNAKYGSKIRALIGNVSTQPTSNAPSLPPAAMTPQAPAPILKATQDEAYSMLFERLNKKGIADAQINERWFADIAATGVPQTEITPAQWGQLKADYTKL